MQGSPTSQADREPGRPRSTLRLKDNPAEVGTDASENGLEVDVMDLRLPCRLFEVGYQVAEPGRFTLTTEFLLRLLKAVEWLSEAEIADFFGFSVEEAVQVVSAAERKELVFRNASRVRLTEAGNTLFDQGIEEPELYQVERKTGWFWFDLVSFCPAYADRLEAFENTLPEIPIRKPELAANASQQVLAGFRRHFHELQRMYDRHVGEKSTPYTVDHVVAQQRSSAIVPLSVRVRRDDPGKIEPDLLGWKSGNDLDDRMDVLESCGSFLRSYVVPSTYRDDGGAELLRKCAPEQTRRFFRGAKFDAPAYFRRASVQAGDLRADRKTARIYGTLWTPRNRSRLAAAVQYSSSFAGSENGPLIWLCPLLPYWGCSRNCNSLIGNLAISVVPVGSEDPVKAMLLSHEDRETLWRFGDVFDTTAVLRPDRVPRNFELLLVPGRLFAALTYAPLHPRDASYPIALGVISFDPVLIRMAHEVMTDIVTDGLPNPLQVSPEEDWAGNLLDALQLPDGFGDTPPAFVTPKP